MWQKLRTERQTSWEHWREPFEQSEGLMLEYIHVLTQGRRLQAIIGEQVQQRQQEKRTDGNYTKHIGNLLAWRRGTDKQAI